MVFHLQFFSAGCYESITTKLHEFPLKITHEVNSMPNETEHLIHTYNSKYCFKTLSDEGYVVRLLNKANK